MLFCKSKQNLPSVTLEKAFPLSLSLLTTNEDSLDYCEALMKQVNDTTYLTQCLPTTERAQSSHSPFIPAAQRDGVQHIDSLSCPNRMAAGLQTPKWGIACATASLNPAGAAHMPLPPSIQASWMPWPHPALCSGDLWGFKDSSLDSTQTMFLLGMYTGGGMLKGVCGGGEVEPTPFQNEATPPSAWLSWNCPLHCHFLLLVEKWSLAHSHSSSSQGLGVRGAVHSSYKAGRRGGSSSKCGK